MKFFLHFSSNTQISIHRKILASLYCPHSSQSTEKREVEQQSSFSEMNLANLANLASLPNLTKMFSFYHMCFQLGSKCSQYRLKTI